MDKADFIIRLNAACRIVRLLIVAVRCVQAPPIPRISRTYLGERGAWTNEKLQQCGHILFEDAFKVLPSGS